MFKFFRKIKASVVNKLSDDSETNSEILYNIAVFGDGGVGK